MIPRDLHYKLREWRESKLRMPLIIRGARQVGKSSLVKQFGTEFKTYIEINFEKDKNAAKLFTNSIEIKDIIKNIEYYTGKKINPGTTLIFLDEIQECENAYRSLRYFKEEYPDIHVIAAGSLLEFLIDRVGIPVGRVQFMYLYPLSFGEFLVAIGEQKLREAVITGVLPDVMHDKMLEYVKYYTIIGGMPYVANTWINHNELTLCQEAQDIIINTYRQDFEKYSKANNVEYLDVIFNELPSKIGEKFVYSSIAHNLTSYKTKQALDLLCKAGIAYRCYHSKALGHPLAATKDIKKFKTFFFDIGLAQRIMGLDIKQWLISDTFPQYNGKIAEQFVAQELVAYGNFKTHAELFYWHRENKSSNAEVDFITSKDGQITPIEVKSGTKGRMISLNIFLKEHTNSKLGLKISKADFAQFENYHQIPFYAIEYWLNNIRSTNNN